MLGTRSLKEVPPEFGRASEDTIRSKVNKVSEQNYPKVGEPSASHMQFGTRRSKHLGSIVTGNHDELEEINEDISTNYAE